MRVDRYIQALFSDLLNYQPELYAARHTAKASLEGLHALFTQCDIRYYAVFGTLLACIRNQALFSYDHDIDLAIHRHDLALFRQCLPQALSLGFRVSELGYSVIKLRSIPADTAIDIWVIEPAPVYAIGYIWRLDHALFRRNYFSTPAHAPCYAVMMSIPQDAHHLLADCYGPQWRVPDTTAFCVYRPVLSRVLAWPFITSVVPMRFSHDPKSCRYRPWVKAIGLDRLMTML